MHSINEYLVFLMKFISEAIEGYRSIVYPIVGILPFHVPSVMIDFVISLTLSGFIGDLFFRREHSQLQKLIRQNKAFNSIWQEAGLYDMDERFKKLPIHKKFSVIREIPSLLFMASPKAVREFPYLLAGPVIIAINRSQIFIFIFVFFLTSYWIDLYYRTFIV